MQQHQDQQGAVVVPSGQVVDEGGDPNGVGQATVVLPGVPLAIPLPQVHMPVQVQQPGYMPTYSFQDASRPIQYTPTYIPATAYYQHDPNQQHAAPQPQYHPVQPQAYAYHPATTHHVQQAHGEQDPELQAQAAGADYSQTQPGSPSQGGSMNQSASRRGRGISETGPMFKQTVQKSTLWSLDRQRNFTLRIYPKIDRGFFLADNDWTCYRRNYFQVSATFTAVDAHGQRVELPCYVEVEDRLRTVTGFLINCVARTHNGNKEIELVQHTAKRDKGPQTQPAARLCEPMDPTVRHEDSFHSVTFERLQFKSATANNGKRRAAQQYHVLLVELFVRCDDGSQFKVASAESGPLVVRGRAPGHYAAMSSKQAAQQAGTLHVDEMGQAYDPHFDNGGHSAFVLKHQMVHHASQAHYSTYPAGQHPEAATHYYQPIHQQQQQTVSHYYQTQPYDSSLWNQQGHPTAQFDPQTGAPHDHTLHYTQQQLDAGGYQPAGQMVDANGQPIDPQQAQFDQEAHYAHPVYHPQPTDEAGNPMPGAGADEGPPPHEIHGVIQEAIEQAAGGEEQRDVLNGEEVGLGGEGKMGATGSGKKRGRPKRGAGEEGLGETGVAGDLPPKKKRGRPKKSDVEEEVGEDE
ncbi:meiosis-specific transcription factor ndt80 [Dinochytrium kinnereticum]|nr:meiosis-specific transcription factor ndt80 [Dinochytrium kinnereticum]